MSVIFVLPDFKSDNLRLQPWLTFYRVAKEMQAQGQTVAVITDVVNDGPVDGIEVIGICSLRSSGRSQILAMLEEKQATTVFVPVTPLSLMTCSWYKDLSRYKAYAFMSYAFYNTKEMSRAWPYLTPASRKSFGKHLLIPRLLWRSRLTRHFSGVISQSVTTQQRMVGLGVEASYVHYIPPGTDSELWNSETKQADDRAEGSILYLGSPYAIRGFELLLDAMALIDNEAIKLRVLARGATGERREELLQDLASRGLAGKVIIEGGWLDVERLKDEIQAARAVALPFVLVPSELPVTVYEAIASGTPVIGTRIDGLPSAVGKAGVLVDVGDEKALQEAIERVVLDTSYRQQLEQHCKAQGAALPSWRQVAEQWSELS